ncbi:tetrapyrrole biosynthesis, uroporphyrinogen III synthase [Lineolata rhizophorae]|uniref:Tetrapyrrole biosynthesis, uroporphyrinogen III synthase n=1 Tax=Lineolata rhizophorae TaxID=578093 RepID=A0A6A6P0L6_9PEZI|nr:tetrapyrrole biosynthesis, uroporphyrinogen III synthase [Lineolata rhizophorae]
MSRQRSLGLHSELGLRRNMAMLLLKSKSVPTDAYESRFDNLYAQPALSNGNSEYTSVRDEPVQRCLYVLSTTFVPVLDFVFIANALTDLRELIERGGLDTRPEGGLRQAKYGGVIFTSQRAVEAFATVVTHIRRTFASRGRGNVLSTWLPKSTPLYVVGPATAGALVDLDLQCPILGIETGNGETLAQFILNDYNAKHVGRAIAATERSMSNEAEEDLASLEKLPLLFLVGKERRDIIPKTLRAEELGEERRIGVDEMVVYEAKESRNYPNEFRRHWETKKAAPGMAVVWVVIFSPKGVKAMLEVLDVLDKETGKVDQERLKNLHSGWQAGDPPTRIVAIGPTTRNYLVREFGLEPDVCAERPSPEGVWEGMFKHMNGLAGRDVRSGGL